MAATLYFTRHGETIWNAENKICGATDIALTPRGHAQAEELGRALAQQGLPVDLILTAPLARAQDRRHLLPPSVHADSILPEFRLADLFLGKPHAPA